MKRIVLKVGSAVLTQDGKLAFDRLNNLVDLIAKLKQQDKEVILVSSGAVAAGFTSLPLDKKSVTNRQALAAIGQPLLMKHYKTKFKEYGITCAQMLLIADDFDSRKRTAFAKGAIEILLKNKIMPIINENDVTATDELLFGDNDQLAAHVTYYFDADILAILTDIDGYYNKNPRVYADAVLEKHIASVSAEMLEGEHTPNTEFATGGIVTKLKAADFLIQKNIPMYLSSGFDLKFAEEFLVNHNHLGGTLFKA
ncbi:MAG: glutamate 5-kinase [Candidatus Marinarcus sp.]|uniref:glutamate 5-kinase n=1 Tax=Candidatus Marinarcus sp. TaxID=3100987 RepID=UPI003B00D1B2